MTIEKTGANVFTGRKDINTKITEFRYNVLFYRHKVSWLCRKSGHKLYHPKCSHHKYNPWMSLNVVIVPHKS